MAECDVCIKSQTSEKHYSQHLCSVFKHFVPGNNDDVESHRALCVFLGPQSELGKIKNRDKTVFFDSTNVVQSGRVINYACVHDVLWFACLV